MLLRLCKSLAVAILLIGTLCASPVFTDDLELEIPYFPEVVFRQSPLSFHLHRNAQLPVHVLQNGQETRVFPPSSSSLIEYTFSPDESAVMRFYQASPEQAWVFQIICPGDAVTLSEKDGYLFHGETPVILMPDHRLPTPLDRRWETVHLIEKAMQSHKPSLGAVVGFLPENSSLKVFLPQMQSDGSLELIPPHPDAWFRVHGYLLATPAQSSCDFLVVEMDLFDMERGMSPQTWFMKWQFLLQQLQSTLSYKDGLLFGPVYDETSSKWKDVLDSALKGLARAHGLRFVDRSISPELWKERLRFQLGKSYLLP
ncbi:hypothetical protein P3T73_09635 [Kiritimatiellota bacterium B12222]|nr:hypothetical protein P3T73_09635 [Kiritimatiellota bacterium B12222]